MPLQYVIWTLLMISMPFFLTLTTTEVDGLPKPEPSFSWFIREMEEIRLEREETQKNPVPIHKTIPVAESSSRVNENKAENTTQGPSVKSDEVVSVGIGSDNAVEVQTEKPVIGVVEKENSVEKVIIGQIFHGHSVTRKPDPIDKDSASEDRSSAGTKDVRSKGRPHAHDVMYNKAPDLDFVDRLGKALVSRDAKPLSRPVVILILCIIIAAAVLPILIFIVHRFCN